MKNKLKDKLSLILIASILGLTLRLAFPIRGPIVPFFLVLLLLVLVDERPWGNVFYSILLLLFAVIYRREILQGMVYLVNEIRELYGQMQGLYLPDYAGGKELWQFWNFFYGLLALLVYLSLKNKQVLISLTLLVLSLVLQAWLEFSFSLYWLLFPLSLVLVLSGKSRQWQDRFVLLFISVFLVLLGVGLVPLVGYMDKELTPLMDQVSEASKQVFYGHYEFPKGDLSKVKPFKNKENKQYEVDMEAFAPLYLRSYIGEILVGDQWKALKYQEQKELFRHDYWLREKGFIPELQLAQLQQLVGKAQGQKIRIKSLGGSKTEGLISYDALSLPGVIKKNNASYGLQGIFGSRIQEYSTLSNLVFGYPTLAKNIYQKIDEEELAEYLDAEKDYRKLVYTMYTKLNPSQTKLLKERVNIQQKEGERISYESALDFVKSYTRKHLSYQEDIWGKTGSGNQLLGEKTPGYSPHYASLGTLIFRYLGIPARYVEGYVILPEDQGEKVFLRQKNQHAWTEIYVDYIGWIPVELTPSYEEAMPKVDLRDYPKVGDRVVVREDASSGENPLEDFYKEEFEDEPTQAQEQKEDKFWSYLPAIIGFFLLLALILLIARFVRRRKAFRKKEEEFQAGERSLAHEFFAYGLKLAQLQGVERKKKPSEIFFEGEKEQAVYEKMLKYYLEASYSQHPLEEGYEDKMISWKNYLLASLMEKASWFKKLQYRFWDVYS